MARHNLCLLMLSLALAGCQATGDTTGENSGGSSGGNTGGAPSAATATQPKQSNPAAAPTPATATVVFIDSQPFSWDSFRQVMIEAAGGQVLLEEVLDRGVARRLAERKLAIAPAAIAREQELLAQSLDSDPDQAQRLLNELRDRRGLGEVRFQALLTRNAGLRALVQNQVQVNDAAVRQAYDNQFGPRYESRIIVVDTLTTAADVARRAAAGDPFTDLAIKWSTDSSRAQGGLLSPISPADPTYPQAVREALVKLQPGQVSDPVALEHGYAVLKLERKINGPGVTFDDVKDTLALGVRVRVEQMLMQRLARTIVTESDVVVLDPVLQKGWNQQRKRLLTEGQ